MLATLAEPPLPSLENARLVYEPKYDGIRALVEIVPRKGGTDVRLFSRLGNEKSAQFPELVEALSAFGARLRASAVVDGEIVALDGLGEPAGFQRLQGRLHLGRPGAARRPTQPVALIVFDLLRDGRDALADRPWTERRARLERLFGKKAPDPFSPIRLSATARGDGRALFAKARECGWEGLIVKRADSPYRVGRRSPDWLKLKLVHEQEFVVGGWTDPRASREHFGALLLGYYEGGALKYAGHTGSGFDEQELARVKELLDELARRTCPFDATPRTNERPHWVKPQLVAQVKFTEWTDEGLLRHPIYLGLRHDVKPETVRREPPGPARLSARAAPTRTLARTAAPSGNPGRTPAPSPSPLTRTALDRLRDDLTRIEAERGNGVLSLPGEIRVSVTNLRKVFWPGAKITKGELLRYYVAVAPYLLPIVEDRPLVMKRFPNGITGKAFYQQRAPDTVPEAVRAERVAGDTDVPARLVGGSLATLLHMAQLAAISQDPWFSRVQSPREADHAAIDLDPGEGVPFSRVLDTARWVRDELEAIGVRGFPKTSGADGLHIYIPLEPGTPYEAGMLFCQILATVVAQKHPKVATVERTVRQRGRTVYVDCLQNIEGRTLACAYSARASDYAGASTPLTWEEVDEGLDRRDFTIRTLPARLDQVGDLWARLRTSRGANLLAVERYVRG
ncbi:MAG: DNA ligase D [Gemmatimonadetes bacterium]|nr:DNA ligase D [Gemmatimonadota bacterium]